jgi:nucleotide-binding universal stress UspA family protein
MAATLGCPVRLLHAYVVPVTFGEMPLPVMPAEDARQLAVDQLNSALASLRSKFPDADISGDVLYGDLADVLDEAANEVAPLLIVIGNDEDTDAEGWIGSNATHMLREAGHPVLAVPHAAVYRKPEHVCIAVDSRSIDEGASVEALLRLQTSCGFRITVLHILRDGEVLAAFTQTTLGKQLTAGDPLYVELSSSGAVDTLISNFASTHGMDWLAVIPHQYGFWEGLFHKSHTAQMLHIAQLPILALHA